MYNNKDAMVSQASKEKEDTYTYLCMAVAHLAKAVDKLASNNGSVNHQEFAADELSPHSEIPKAYDLNNDKRLRLNERKVTNMVLEKVYKSLGNVKKAQRTHDCGTYVQINHTKNGRNKLKYINSCRGRLCPTCMWLLSRKVAHNITKLMNYMAERDKEKRFALLTLTKGRVSGEELKNELNYVLKSWKALSDKRAFERMVYGLVRSIEITHDIEPTITKKMYTRKRAYYMRTGQRVGDINPFYNTYHLHIHVFLHMDKSYVNKLRTKERRLEENVQWSKMWREALNIDYDPIVDIRPFDKGQGHGAYELAKYVVKPDDYIYENEEHMLETIKILDDVLFNRMLIAYTGTFRKARQELKLNDKMIDDKEDMELNEVTHSTRWYWNFGYSQYNQLQ